MFSESGAWGSSRFRIASLGTSGVEVCDSLTPCPHVTSVPRLPWLRRRPPGLVAARGLWQGPGADRVGGQRTPSVSGSRVLRARPHAQPRAPARCGRCLFRPDRHWCAAPWLLVDNGDGHFKATKDLIKALPWTNISHAGVGDSRTPPPHTHTAFPHLEPGLCPCRVSRPPHGARNKLSASALPPHPTTVRLGRALGPPGTHTAVCTPAVITRGCSPVAAFAWQRCPLLPLRVF